MKKKVYKIPIYHGDLILYQTNDLKAIETEYGFPERCTDGFGAITFSDHKEGYTRYIMAFSENQTPGDIAHEALHCVRYIYLDRGIQFVTDNNDEHQCYLIGWIVNKAYNFLKLGTQQ